MKIAILIGELPTTIFIDRLVRGLEDDGLETLLIGKINAHFSQKPFKSIIIGYTNPFNQLLVYVRFWLLLTIFRCKHKRKLDKILEQENVSSWRKKTFFYPVLFHSPDIVHVLCSKSAVDWMWVQHFKIKMVISLRGAHINYSPIFSKELTATYKRCFPKIDGFHAVSQAIFVEAQKYGATLEKINVIYSGLPTDKLHFFQKDSISTPLQIISVGRNHWYKGYTTALDAMALLKIRGISFNFTLIGVEPSEELWFQYHDLSLLENVQFITSLSYEQVTQKIQASDILITSSIGEDIPNEVIEAMALGTFVIATDCDGMTEAIEDGVSGLIVPVLDPEAIADAILKVSEMPIEVYQTITKNARIKVEGEFSENSMIQGMKSLYQKVIAS